ncbi:RelA/SpoT domain-containing protein [Sphingomonas sp. MJ1 (PH-R8)]|uniref:GTP pyrophosphokinase n=1 Tax=Sphingomonas sp. MJ1 (PH-R8) TaxID=3112950 RepID=UPI003A87BF97
MTEQISALLQTHGVALGVPLESRVKSWSSIEEKVSRKGYQLREITELGDLVGVRLILLFRRDRQTLNDIIKSNFDVVSHEDAGARLGESQFGYQSHHYAVRLKNEWLRLPSYADLGGISIEIQARTIAQHIWAAASHKLQYKHEDSVPPPLRRTINRVSALLETVDLEFDRVLEERATYLAESSQSTSVERTLNVDLVDIIATKILPPANRDPDDENLDEVLRDLVSLGITTSSQLQSLLTKHIDAVMEEDRRQVPDFVDPYDEDYDRTTRGVYFTFAGLIRQALIEEFGRSKVNAVMQSRRAEDPDAPVI